MNHRQAKKVIVNSLQRYRLSTYRQAAIKLNKFAPKWAQPLKISGVVCRCWADGLVQVYKRASVLPQN